MRQLSELAAELDIQQASEAATEKLKPLTTRWEELQEELLRFQKNYKHDKVVSTGPKMWEFYFISNHNFFPTFVLCIG